MAHTSAKYGNHAYESTISCECLYKYIVLKILNDRKYVYSRENKYYHYHYHNSKETVGKYLARAKTLVKSKLKDATSWHHDIDEADAYHVCNGLIKTGLKFRMFRRVSQFKTY